MKKVVVHECLNEFEVHPKNLYKLFIDACTNSSSEMLRKKEIFRDTACPACNSSEKESAFEKNGYTYWNCSECATLFISPRPSALLIDWYLKNSPVASFRKSHQYKQAMSKRTKEQATYRADWISNLCQSREINRELPVVDVETRTPDYITELKQHKVEPIVIVKPLDLLNNSLALSSGLVTKVDHLKKLKKSSVRLISLFEILEHQSNPFNFFLDAHNALCSEGLIVITTRSSSGFDIQVLWENSTIFPVEHMNLISIEGIRILLKKIGFEILEVSTPGQLDVQMVERVLHQQKMTYIPYFIKYFLKHRSEFEKNRLQQFLQENLLSSHLRIVAKKI